MIKMEINNYGDLEWNVHFWVKSKENWQLFKKSGKIVFTAVSPFQEALEQTYNALTELKGIFNRQVSYNKINVKEFKDGWTVSQKELNKYYEIITDRTAWKKIHG